MKELETYIKKGPKAVILFHSFSSGPVDMNALGKALARENYTVLMPTFDGHGTGQPEPVLNYTVNDWLKNGQDAYDQLKADGYTDISVFGLSLGGVIATHIALHNKVRSYGIFSSPMMTSEDSNVPETFGKWLASEINKQEKDQSLANKKIQHSMDKLEKILSELNEFTTDMKKDYRKIDVPVFIAQGQADELIKAEQAQAFKEELIHAPVVDFHCIEDAPHVITVGRAGQQVQKDLIKFLDNYA